MDSVFFYTPCISSSISSVNIKCQYDIFVSQRIRNFDNAGVSLPQNPITVTFIVKPWVELQKVILFTTRLRHAK